MRIKHTATPPELQSDASNTPRGTPAFAEAQRTEILQLPRVAGPEPSQPDAAWIKKHVSVLKVGHELGMRIRQRRGKCWRPQNHTNGDFHPSLYFYERGNRVRCFVCDMRGGHSNIDLVMGVLGITFSEAVHWIAERFPVPNVKPGRPVGRRATEPHPYRVGVQGSELEVLVRSGMFGQLSAAESRILLTLHASRDWDTGTTRLSYLAIMRYSGVGSRKSVAIALKGLQRLHALQISRGSRIGITRECSVYRVTLDDPKFLELCEEVYGSARTQIAQGRTYRQHLRSLRENQARETREHEKPKSCALIVTIPMVVTEAGAYATPEPPESDSVPSPSYRSIPSESQQNPTCEGLNLSSPRELDSNRSVPNWNRESGVSEIWTVGSSNGLAKLSPSTAAMAAKPR